MTTNTLPESITGVSFSPDGQHVLVWSGRELRLYAAAVAPLLRHALESIRFQPEFTRFEKHLEKVSQQSSEK